MVFQLGAERVRQRIEQLDFVLEEAAIELVVQDARQKCDEWGGLEGSPCDFKPA